MEILLEHVINLWSDIDKSAYAQSVWDILQSSYKFAGGFKTAVSPEELVHKSGLWKIVTRGGEITAINIYQDQYGRKSIATGTNGTVRGTRDYMMLRLADKELGRAWGEVSGIPEKIMKKIGATPISSKYAVILTKHNILSYNEDGYHYTRLIQGEPHEKIMYGTVNLSTNDIEYIESQGISLNPFPSNFKRK